VVTEPVAGQAALKLLVAVLTLATLDVVVVRRLRVQRRPGPVGHRKPAVRAVRVGFRLDDHLPRVRPGPGLIPEPVKQALRLAGLLVLGDRLGQQPVTPFPQHGVAGQAEGVDQPQPLADVVHPRDPEAGVATHFDLHPRPGRPQAPHQVLQVVIGPESGVRAAVPQADHHDQVVVGAGDNERQILVLLVVAVEEDQLLTAVRGVIHGIEVEEQVARRRGERGEELVDQGVAQAFQRGDVDGVLKARQGGLAGQVGVGGQAAGNEFEDGFGAQGVVVVLIFVAGEDAVEAGTEHFEDGVLDEPGVAGVVEGGSKVPGEAELFVELADREQPGIAAETGIAGLDDDGAVGEKIEEERRRRL
jgi:hypothetical protein